MAKTARRISQKAKTKLHDFDLSVKQRILLQTSLLSTHQKADIITVKKVDRLLDKLIIDESYQKKIKLEAKEGGYKWSDELEKKHPIETLKLESNEVAFIEETFKKMNDEKSIPVDKDMLNMLDLFGVA